MSGPNEPPERPHRRLSDAAIQRVERWARAEQDRIAEHEARQARREAKKASRRKARLVRYPKLEEANRTLSRIRIYRISTVTRNLWVNPILWLGLGMALIEAMIFVAGSIQALMQDAGWLSLFVNPLRAQVFELLAFKAHPVDGAVAVLNDVLHLQRCLDTIQEADLRGIIGPAPPCAALDRMLAGIGRWDVLRGFDWAGAVPSIILHANVLHAVVNLSAFVALAPVVALRFGPARFVLFFVLCGLAGNALFWAIVGLGWAYGPPFGLRLPLLPVIGASGAIFGLLAVHFRLSLRAARAQGRARGVLGLVRYVFQMTFWIVLLHVLFAITQMPIAWEAHLGGLIMGLVLAPLMARTPAAFRAHLRGLNKRYVAPRATPAPP